MRVRSGARIAATLIACGILALGLWQCEREPTGSAPGALKLLLRLGQADSISLETVEIEVLRGGGLAASDTVAVLPDGSFTCLLPIPAGEDYAVRAYAWGSGPAAMPDSSTHGVLAVGQAAGIALRPGRVTAVELTMAEARPALQAVSGQPGYFAMQLTWNSIPGATMYTLGWFSVNSGAQGFQSGILDTTFTVNWSSPGALAAGLPEAAGTDSVVFRVRPYFGPRAGVFGPGRWSDLSLWMDLPHLVSIAPGHAAPVEADTARVWLGFDRAMDEASLLAGVQWSRRPDGAAIPFAVDRPFFPAALYRLTPEEGHLAREETYQVRISSAVADSLGQPFDADPGVEGLQIAFVEWSTVPYVPLQVLAMDPPHASEEVDLDVEVRVAFNRRVAAATLGGSAFFVTDPNGIRVSGVSDTAATADTVRWHPQDELWFGSTYTVHVTSLLQDTAGNPFDGNPSTYPQLETLELRFTTRPQPEGPYVTAVSPEADARGVPLDAAVQVTFSEPVDPASVNYEHTFKVLRYGYLVLPGSISMDATGRVFTLVPSSPFLPGTWHEVCILGVTDLEGNLFDQDSTRSDYQAFGAEFRSADPPAVAASSPADGDSAVAIDAALEVTFTRPVDPQSINADAVRLLDGADLLGHTPTLDADSLDLTIRPDLPLAYLRTYQLVVDTLVLGGDGSRFDHDAATAGNQAFAAFFTTKPESIHPQVTLSEPADGDSNVAVGATPHVVFSVPIMPATITSETVTLSRDGEPVAGELTLAADSLSVTLYPADSLANGAWYDLEVTSWVQSASGFYLDQEPGTPGHQGFAAVFRTVRETVPPRVIYSQPTNGASAVALDDPIIIDFSEPVDSASVAAGFALIMNGAPVSGSGATSPGGDIWAFQPAAPLQAATRCTVRVDTTVVDLAGNALDQIPETAVADPFEIAFFTEGELIGPRVIGIEPASGSTGAPVDEPLHLFFDEPLNPASVTDEALRLWPAIGPPLAGEALLVGGGEVITWTPVAEALEFSASYTVIVDSLLEDLFGNRHDQDPSQPGCQMFQAEFATMPENIPPQVVALLPTARPVSPGVTPILLFSEAMDSLTLRQSGVIDLRADSPEGAALDCALEIAAAADSVRIVPAQSLAHGAVYWVTVTSAARDLAGNPLDPAFADSFSTTADVVPPQVTLFYPADGATHVGPDEVLRIEFSEPLDPLRAVDPEAVHLTPAGGPDVELERVLDAGGQVLRLTPLDSLAQGMTYSLVATSFLQDLAGNALHPEDWATFVTGTAPQIIWDGALCVLGDTARVEFDASASLDPDAGDSVAVAVWDWGDGERDSLDAPQGLIVAHDFPGQDSLGCDGIDNDDDGLIDQVEGDCDESYVVTLWLYDSHGIRAAAVAGVSFCAFRVSASQPLPGEVVDSSAVVRLTLTRAVNAASVNAASVNFTSGQVTIAYTASFEDGSRVVVLTPDQDLDPGNYTVEVTSAVVDEDGAAFDQDPSTPGRQSFWLTFSVP